MPQFFVSQGCIKCFNVRAEQTDVSDIYDRVLRTSCCTTSFLELSCRLQRQMAPPCNPTCVSPDSG